MFEPSDTPRFFTVPLGADFPQALVTGLRSRLDAHPPEATAQVEIFVNTRRMERRLHALLTENSTALLPKIRLITDLAASPGLSTLPQPIAPLKRRLELRQLVKQLLTAQPDLAPLHTALDHADTLADLIAEMHGEGVSLETVLDQDLAEHADHWQQAVKFLEIIAPFFDDSTRPSPEARQRAVVEALIARWRTDPPSHPILIAGSTGSRGTTALLMQAVARLPQGAVILPGFDPHMPPEAWDVLASEDAQDHPQFRLHKLLRDAGLDPNDTEDWETLPVNTPRARLVSLALRPAPITDAWLEEGPDLPNLQQATDQLSLLEAETPREEALAIAVRLRAALNEGKRAAVITPDRTLTRRITAALDQWHLIPDDSAGTPLQQSPAGRLARQTAELLGTSPDPAQLLTLLKHPQVRFGERGPHLKHTRDLELNFLRGGPAKITSATLRRWAENTRSKLPDPDWFKTLRTWLDANANTTATTLNDWITQHRTLLGMLTGADWSGDDVTATLTCLEDIADASPQAGFVTAADYAQILSDMLSRGEIRNALAPHPDLMIWGTLEARVQGADLVILAGLNEGIWPEAPAPDPWLNRKMRARAGLFLPERLIGLSAHDFQQGLMAPEVLLTRAKRDAEAETVPSRWLNRLTSLLDGLPETGRPALKQMRVRGQLWHAHALALEHVAQSDPEPRPAPCPPVPARPKELYVTRIEWLIRDPYAIYARHILGLAPLDPLTTEPTAAHRGIALHKVMERFVKATADNPSVSATDLIATAEQVLSETVDFPAIRALWLSRFRPAAEWFAAWETTQRITASPRFFEETGARSIPTLDFTLKGRADRIDIGPGGASVYDYKTGSAPTKKQEDHFNKQLPLLAAIAAEGGFDKLGKTAIDQAGFLLIGSAPHAAIRDYTPDDLARVWDDLTTLLSAYQDPDKGYPARRAVEENRWEQPYDHLARYGEWDTTQEPRRTKVGQ